MNDSFEKWAEEAQRHGALTLKAAYLAGQSSAEQRVKEITELHNGIVKNLQEDIAELEARLAEIDRPVRLSEWQELQAKCAELERERNHWEEEARRYCNNADFWREQTAALKAQAGELTEQLELKTEHERQCIENIAKLQAKCSELERELANEQERHRETKYEWEMACERYNALKAQVGENNITGEQLIRSMMTTPSTPATERPDHRAVMRDALKCLERPTDMNLHYKTITALREALK